MKTREIVIKTNVRRNVATTKSPIILLGSANIAAPLLGIIKVM